MYHYLIIIKNSNNVIIEWSNLCIHDDHKYHGAIDKFESQKKCIL